MSFRFSRARAARRTLLSTVAAAALVGTATFTGAGAASAHVTANAPTLTQGGYGVVTFVVPNESDVAPTTELKVTLPGLKSARPEVMPGWKAVVTKNDDVATEITWTAEPGTPAVPVGEFAQFRFSGGPFPEEDEVMLPALQIYADGEQANWNQPTPEDGTEPEKPAPTLTLAEGSDDGHGHSAASSDSDDSDDDSTAIWLGGAGLLVGALGVVFGVAALMRARRTGGSDA